MSARSSTDSVPADFVRWLYGWRSPPAEAMRDVAALQADPAERLARGPVEFGPARTTLAVALLVAGVALFVGFALNAEIKNDRDRLMVPLLGFAYFALFLWGAVTVWTIRGSRLILDANGVVFVNRRKLLFCPWGLFNATGGPFLDPKKPHRVEMPINPAAIPDIVLRRPNAADRKGTDAKTNEFRFSRQDSLKLCLFYAIDATTVVHLLLHVGRQMGAPADAMPRLHAAPSAAAPESVWTGGDEAVVIDHNGWITIDAVRARFPPLCCVCGGTTTETHRLAAKSGFLALFGGEPASIHVPCCAPCQRTLGRLQRRGVWLVAGLALLFPIIAFAGLLGPVALVMVAFVVVVLIRFGAPDIFSPVRSRYKPLGKRFSFWFRQPGYAEQVQNFIRNSDDWRPRDPPRPGP